MFFCFSLKKLWKLCGYILTIGLVFVLIRIVVLPQIFERPYSEVVEKHAQMYNVDENLIYSVMFTESGFDEKALSPKGAKGLMQIMDITGGWGGEYLKIENYSPEMLFDADVNIQIGTWYLGYLINQYKNEETALAAYNAGSGNVSKWLSNTQYSSDGKTLDEIPFAETNKYVKKVYYVKIIYDFLYN